MKKFLFILLWSCFSDSKAQTTIVSANSEVLKSSVESFFSVDKKVVSLNSQIEKKTVDVLKRMQKHEEQLQKKLAKKDSIAAKMLFAQNKYEQLVEQVKNPEITKKLNEYIPHFDSLKTSIKFLNERKELTSRLPLGIEGGLSTMKRHVAGLETKLQQANEIKSFIKERKELLKKELGKFNMLKDMKKLNKETYYYHAQLKEYKELLKDRKKVEKKAIEELKKIPAFTAFMKKHSQLAELFRMPDNSGTPQSLAGLQTRGSVQGVLQSRLSGANVNPQQYLNQQMQAAQGELNKLKSKINKAGGSSSDTDMPDFKPNSQKTKSFMKRIEYGANVQTQKTNGWLPVTSDFAFTAGYKLNDKSTIGLGASYKLGWGSGLSNIKLTSQGMGLRSFVDYNIKGGFWLSGGYEQNYQHEFNKIDILKDLSNWQSSGLIGLTKKYKIGRKTNNLQLLWDFLSYQQMPSTQPIVFRVGYTF